MRFLLLWSVKRSSYLEVLMIWDLMIILLYEVVEILTER
jgi:hypothetical protein